MMNKTLFLGWSLSRWVTHGVMLALTLLVWALTAALKPTLQAVHSLTIATGYAAFIMLVLTLVIGMWTLLRRQTRRNPINLYVRRDIGIWAAWIGIAHVIFGFQVHLRGDVVGYFFDQGRLRLDLFGFANDVGLIGVVILIALLVLSNDWSMRWLKGKRWKAIQRLNYILFAAVVAHTLAYQSVVRRETALIVVVIVMTLVVLIVQGIGIRWVRARSLL